METTTTTPTCLCGCKQAPATYASIYRQGHDAHHASLVARDAATTFLLTAWDQDIAADKFLRDLIYRRLPSVALGVKAADQFERLVSNPPKALRGDLSLDEARAIADSDLPAVLGRHVPTVATPDTGEVKIGRWYYPARKLADGTVERNLRTDGSGEWEVTDAEFRPAA